MSPPHAAAASAPPGGDRARRRGGPRPPVRGQQLPALGRDAGPLPRLRRPGVERDDGVRRAALARAIRSTSGSGAYASAGLFFHFGVGPWAGVWLAIVLCAALGGVHRLPRLPLAHLRRSTLAADGRVRRAGAHRLRPHRLARRPGRPVPAGRGARTASISSASAARPRCTTTRCWRSPPARSGCAPSCCAAGPAITGGRSARTRSPRRRSESTLFGWKMRAVVLSSAMTAVAGVFFAFYYNSLFPEQIFSFGRSIEIILGPVIGGLGTLFGPIVGAAAARPARRRDHRAPDQARLRYPRRQAGHLWRPAAARHHLHAERPLAAAGARARIRAEEALTCRSWRSKRSANRFAACARSRGATFAVERHTIAALIGPNGAGKTTLFNLIAGLHRPDAGAIRFDGRAIGGLPPHRVCAAGIGRTFQLVKPFAGLSVLDNAIVGALHGERTVAGARARALAVLERLGLAGKATLARLAPDARRSPAPGGRARARHAPVAAAARRGDGGAAAGRDRRAGRRSCATCSATRASPSS